jgi:hypothetical protein
MIRGLSVTVGSAGAAEVGSIVSVGSTRVAATLDVSDGAPAIGMILVASVDGAVAVAASVAIVVGVLVGKIVADAVAVGSTEGVLVGAAVVGTWLAVAAVVTCVVSTVVETAVAPEVATPANAVPDGDPLTCEFWFGAMNPMYPTVSKTAKISATASRVRNPMALPGGLPIRTTIAVTLS